MRKILIFLSIAMQCFSLQAQPSSDSFLYKHYGYRLIGPFRGGRASGVCGDYKYKQTYYMGATGGGVWQTKDGGNNWKNISDKFFGGSIGSIEVCPTDPLLIYVGTGENTLRGNVSEGNGLWKSTDGGKTWKHVGLGDTKHITKIIFHPRNPNIVYVAAIGHLFGANKERGIFRTTDGGKTWEKVLFVNDEVGAVDMAMDYTNPDIMYASTWRIKRTPYSLESGGDGSALWKSYDGGDTWQKISSKKGFPKDTLGIIGISICASNTDKIYAIVESKTGGLLMSTDGGETWVKQNEESKIRQRAWYFNKVFTDPKNENIVYVCNVEFYKSTDGGKSFTQLYTPHGDHHNLWIDPEDGQRMIIADDGGAQISVDGGKNWSTYMNQPTAQFYRVTTDNHFPYRVLGCQQDNSSVRIMSRTYQGSIGAQDWTSTAGFESGHIAVDPLNDDIVYGGNYGGYLSRLNHQTGEERTVSVYPVSPIGEGADTLKYRFQWNFPILFSPHNPKKLYAAANHLFSSIDEGQTWQMISPDLTRNDKSKQIASGGVITKDNTGVEYYCTIFAIAESPKAKDVIWCGSDDGLVHVTKNGGKNWELVNPSAMPDWMMINCIEPSPFDAGTCYIVGTRYKIDDETPYIYKTNDYGKTWKKITNGIHAKHFTRCMRADPVKKGYLYCGTEQGIYLSKNDGETWQRFQLNLPIVPITDLCLKQNDLVVATQGRSFWILDDRSLLYQMDASIAQKKLHVFQPPISYRMNGSQNKHANNEGVNPPNGVRLLYWLKDITDSTHCSISIFTEKDSLLRTYKNLETEKEDMLTVEQGMNQFYWGMFVKGAEKIEDMILWNGTVGSYKVPPGKYKARIKVEKDSTEVWFTIQKDPNYDISEQDYAKQFAFLTQVKNKFDATQKTIKDIRAIRLQVQQVKDKLGKSYPSLLDSIGKKLHKELTLIEEHLYQTKAKSGQDVLNYPIRLNDKLAGIFDAANQHTAPSKGALDAYQEISSKIDIEIAAFKRILQNDVERYNKVAREKEIGILLLKVEDILK